MRPPRSSNLGGEGQGCPGDTRGNTGLAAAVASVSALEERQNEPWIISLGKSYAVSFPNKDKCH